MKKSGSLILRVVAFLVLCFMLVNLGYYQVRLVNYKSQLNALDKEHSEKEIQIEELKNMIENSDDPEFIESAAREKLGYVYPNERVYYDSWGN
jgi:cell division protein FtsB